MLRKFFIFCFFIFCSMLNAKDTILRDIKEIYEKDSINLKGSKKLECALSSEELRLAKLDSNTPLFPYYNMLLSLESKKSPDKISQDLLMQEVRNKQALATLLALQTYFIKKCERCDRVRDISNFDYYRFADSKIKKILSVEGGDFAHSYALNGEAFLCKALKDSAKFMESKKAAIAYNFLNAYANFMLAGLNTRALDSLIYGIKVTNDNTLFATFKFIFSHDLMSGNNPNAIYLLNILELDSNNHFANIAAIKYFRNLKAIEGSIVSNYVIWGLALRDMDMGRMLSPFSKFATLETLGEFKEKFSHYESTLKRANLKILESTNDTKALNEYYKILKLKKRLKSKAPYGFVERYGF